MHADSWCGDTVYLLVVALLIFVVGIVTGGGEAHCLLCSLGARLQCSGLSTEAG